MSGVEISIEIAREKLCRTQKCFVLVSRQMKHFLEILTDVRIAVGEISVTVGACFLMLFGMHKAWRDYIAKWFK